MAATPNIVVPDKVDEKPFLVKGHRTAGSMLMSLVSALGKDLYIDAATGALHVIVDSGGGGGGGSGDASAANQTTGNNSLASIDTKLSSQATAGRQDTGNTSLAGILSSIQSVDTKLTAQATAAKQDAGNTSLAAIATAIASQATAAKQDALKTVLDNVLTALANNATTTLQTAGNGKLDSIVTALANNATTTLQATGNTSLASIATAIANQATAALQTSANTKLDGLATLLTAISGFVDGLETNTAATNTKLDTLIGDTSAAGVEGTVAHDGVSGTKPVGIGARAVTALPTAVADGDATHLMADKYGRLISRSALRENLLRSGEKTPATTATAFDLIAATANVFLDPYAITFTNKDATNAAFCEVLDGATTIWSFECPPLQSVGFMLDPQSAIPAAAVNTALAAKVTSSAATSVKVYALAIANK